MATDYTQYITSQHQERPRFAALVSLVTGCFGAVTDVLQAMPVAYDLDAAEGVQLDSVGKWVGLGRTLTAPIPNTFFSFDTPGKGWDEGYWKGAFVPSEGIVSLDDGSYRAALRLKIAGNHFTGELQDYMRLPMLLEGPVPNILVVKDNQDMSIDVYILGRQPSLFLRNAIEQEQLIPKPFGVRINAYHYTNTAVFGVDYSTTSIDGPDFGSFLT